MVEDSLSVQVVDSSGWPGVVLVELTGDLGVVEVEAEVLLLDAGTVLVELLFGPCGTVDVEEAELDDG